ncbi:segregation/condensation protein A [Priestia aryabhattai]|uniref:Segregation and condensation protein A n=1 Tax=Priestia aryabhattai TaxID=412384 RepID=A0AAX6NER6_PRIAR|nr:segregation/condensation protein A [Priestia aryabhattai]MDU9694236.1 segregation/condensation protein A [Priestia aryabhattai]
MENFIIKFDEFEGPLDLLIDLIKKRELDIYDLPMSVITKDFINSIELMKENNIEVTAKFTAMASLLLKIKTQMLLPSSKEVDPRNILVKEIEEYEKYKSNLERIKELQFIEQKYFKRRKRDVAKKKKKGSILDVINSYNVIIRKKQLKERNMKLEELSKKLAESKFTIDDQMQYLKDFSSDIDVEKLFEGINDLEEMVVTFSALLELVKVQYFRVEIINTQVLLIKKVL